jgi:hypothetical protein
LSGFLLSTFSNRHAAQEHQRELNTLKCRNGEVTPATVTFMASKLRHLAAQLVPFRQGAMGFDEFNGHFVGALRRSGTAGVAAAAKLSERLVAPLGVGGPPLATEEDVIAYVVAKVTKVVAVKRGLSRSRSPRPRKVGSGGEPQQHERERDAGRQRQGRRDRDTDGDAGARDSRRGDKRDEKRSGRSAGRDRGRPAERPRPPSWSEQPLEINGRKNLQAIPWPLREERKGKGQCLWCGETGHRIESCQNKVARPKPEGRAPGR